MFGISNTKTNSGYSLLYFETEPKVNILSGNKASTLHNVYNVDLGSVM